MTVSVRSARYRPPLSRRELLGRGSASAWEAPLGAPPELAVIALNRMGFGPRPGDIAAFNALGGDDLSRLTAYVDQQLAPNDADDPAYLERRNGLNGLPNPNFLTLGWTLQQMWEAFEVSPTTQSPSNRPAEETRLDTLCRMVYSKWQLREVLADFWHNHFNVYGFENYTQESLVHYDRDVIRPHLFGNFRALLEAVARSTTMLYFLDNYTNTRQGPNENYGRELFELHTLGAENYFGVGNQADVPHWGPGVVWPAGLPSAGQPIPAGYVDNDVYESARSFTGWGVTYATGQYAYTPANHDVFQKAVLSLGVVNIPPNQADEKDGTDVLDMLAAHPGTGRHIARKLCRRLIADDPPTALVESIGDLFTSLRQAPDQIAQVVRAIVLSPEFSSTWGAKIKRPVEFTVSAMRAASPNWLFGYSAQGNPPTMESDMSSLLSRQTKTGHNLFLRVAPDGFADREPVWSSTNTRLQCWRIAGWLVDQDIDGSSGTDDFRLQILDETYAAFPSHQVSPNDLVDFWIPRVFGRTLEPAAREELVDFFAQGGNPATPLNLDSSSSLRSRVRALVALMFMTPDFLLK